MGRRTVISALCLLMLLSLPLTARRLTTTQMRNNTIRINALEIDEVDITRVRGPREVTVVMDSRSLNFDFDKSVVKEQYVPILRNVIDYMVANNYDVTIVGHTDSKGSESYNEKLSMRRAVSVKEKLLELGLSPDRIVGLEARGELEPVASNETEEGRAQNRRIEFNLVRRD